MLLSLLLSFFCIQPADSLLKRVENFQLSAQMQGSTVVASVWNNTKNKQVVDFNSQKWVNPASTLKLLTTATAMHILGADYQFQTTIQFTGTVLNGELSGDLVVHPSGDPTFGSSKWNNEALFSQICQALYAKGIHRISGQIRLSFPNQQDVPDGWIWGDIGNYYGATPSSFNFAENSFTVYFQGDKQEGKPARVQGFSRNMHDYLINNQVTTGAQNSGDQVMIYSSPYAKAIWLKGTVPAGSSRFAVKGALPDPWLTFCTELAESLQIHSISFKNSETPNHSPETKLLTFTSPPLSEIIALCNQESINLYADGLLKASFSEKNRYTTFAESTVKLGAYWQKKGVDWSGFRIEDGSGLSSQNLVQPKSYSQFLGQLVNAPFFSAFLRTIPQMGVSGTVKNLPKTTRPIYVKSGTINGVKTYAGYLKNRDGDWLTFFVGVDRYTAKEAKAVRAFLTDFLVELGK